MTARQAADAEGTAAPPARPGVRHCANPRCGRPLPPWASAARRHCSNACRQARHRASCAPPDHPEADDLARRVRETAGRLAEAAGSAAEGRRARYAAVAAEIAALAEHLTAAAIAHDRARGDSWPALGAVLRTHPEALRRRHRRGAPSPRRPARGGRTEAASA